MVATIIILTFNICINMGGFKSFILVFLKFFVSLSHLLPLLFSILWNYLNFLQVYFNLSIAVLVIYQCILGDYSRDYNACPLIFIRVNIVPLHRKFRNLANIDPCVAHIW